MLLSRPDWHSNESAVGYLIRLSEANGYRHPRHLLHMAKFKEGGKVVRAFIEWMLDHDDQPASLIGVSAEDVQRSDADRGRHRLNVRYLSAEKARYCPICLEESNYWRVEWDHAFCIHCPRHRVWLLNNCNDCGRQIQAWRSALGRCRCGALLCQQKAEPLQDIDDPGLVLSSALLMQREVLLPIEVGNMFNTIPGALMHLSPDQLHQLVYFFGSYAELSHYQKPRKSSFKLDPEVAFRILRGAAKLICAWPSGFHQFLNGQMDSLNGGAGLRRRFGYVYTAIYRDFSCVDFEFLHRAFEDFLQKHWDEVISGRNRRMSEWLKASQGFVSASTAVRLFSVPRHVIEEGVRDGVLKGVITALPSGRRKVVIAKTDIARIPELWDWLDLKTATYQLGLPERRVLELIGAGLLNGDAPKAGETWKIQRGDIRALIDRFRESSVDGLISGPGDVRLSYVIRYYLKPETSFIALLKAMLNAEIKYGFRKDSSGLGNVFFDKQELKIWLQPDTSLVGIPSVAVLMGIKQEVAYHLVRRNLLAAKPNGRRGLLVAREEIQRFQSQYVLARDLAKMLRTSARHVIHRLSVAGVVPVTGPDADGCRQVIYSLTSLGAVPLPPSLKGALGMGVDASRGVDTRLAAQLAANDVMSGKSE